MANQDPYEVLGVGRSASPEEIKSAYRRLARRFHPDVNSNDVQAEEKFKEIGSAYSILSDPDKKARFDNYGSIDDAPSDPFFGGGGGISDLFEAFFGGAQQSGGRGRRGRDGEDIRADTQLTYLEVISGVDREIQVERMAECDSCHGTGVEGGKPPETCTTCRGQGVVGTVRNTFIGQVRTSTTCPTCQGKGTIVKDPCKKCKGRSLIQETANVRVTVPPGVESGATMQIPGQGSDGVGGGRPGDLYLVLEVAEDKRFERRGQVLYTLLELTFVQAALGDKVTIKSVDDSHDIDVPAGTQPGTQFSVRGAGLPPLHGGRRSDLIVQVTVVVPQKLNDAQVKLLKEFAEVSGEEPARGEEWGGLLGGLFGKKK